MAKKTSWLDKMKRVLHIGKGKPDPEDDEFGYDGPEGAGEAGTANESRLASFCYRYIGSIGADSYSYELSFDEPMTFTFESMLYPFGEVSMEADAETATKVAALYETHKLWKWDGFSRSARHVLDGDGFSLSIKFRDGKDMYAHGSNAWPKGYREFYAEMREILKPLEQQLVERENQKIISRGFHGKISSLIANFIQRGQSGRDKYEMFVQSPQIRDQNFHVEIRSDSGTYFEKGFAVNKYYSLADTDPFFEKVDALVRKYDVASWYGWDKAAEDYNNEEWFQLNISYEDGAISAMGTMHPENYDAFREEMILLMKETLTGLTEAEENGDK
ncbi:MAG: hypothetical protein IK125_10085 [Lachnospiraceae bacterium]|nr:hypothetical protein [Lachnospiraceae bacterium]